MPKNTLCTCGNDLEENILDEIKNSMEDNRDDYYESRAFFVTCTCGIMWEGEYDEDGNFCGELTKPT